MEQSVVAVLKTRPETVVADYGRLMEMAEVDRFLPREHQTLIKLNLSWTKYFPSCSSQPWQVDGVARAGCGSSRRVLAPPLRAGR